jgi:hypothetical protein
LYFLIPIIGIYYGHFVFDSISTGDGIMWGKIPWKKGHYAQYVNLFSSKTDGYHGIYWNVRYRKTIFFKLGLIVVIISTVIILVLIFTAENFDIFYLISIIYLISFSLSGLKKYPEQYSREPPEGRYADYRRNPKYIEGLSERNRKKLLKKYS